MPRLPSAEELGFAPSLGYRRGLASIDMSPLARGRRGEGRGPAAVRTGISSAGLSVGRAMEKAKAETGTLEGAQARADVLTA